MPHSHHSFHCSRTRTLLPLDIVCLSYHLLHASPSLYPSPRASFASNTHMHVYRSISQHIPRSTLTTPPSIDVPHKLCLSFLLQRVIDLPMWLRLLTTATSSPSSFVYAS